MKLADGRAVEFRKSTPDDFEFVFVLEESLRRDGAAAWNATAERVKTAKSFRPGEDLIVRVGGIDVGLLALGSYKELLWLRRLELLPEAQRLGIGTTIIKHVLHGANAKGAGVFLRIRKGNPARKLAERLGFVQSGETKAEDEMIAPPESKR